MIEEREERASNVIQICRWIKYKTVAHTAHRLEANIDLPLPPTFPNI